MPRARECDKKMMHCVGCNEPDLNDYGYMGPGRYIPGVLAENQIEELKINPNVGAPAQIKDLVLFSKNHYDWMIQIIRNRYNSLTWGN